LDFKPVANGGGVAARIVQLVPWRLLQATSKVPFTAGCGLSFCGLTANLHLNSAAILVDEKVLDTVRPYLNLLDKAVVLCVAVADGSWLCRVSHS
jgi:hypothetical protein